MTPRLSLSIIAIAVLLAVVVTLLSGGWRVDAAPQGAPEQGNPARSEGRALPDGEAGTVPALPGVPLQASVSEIRVTPAPGGTPTTVTVRGTWAYAEPSHGASYLAIPEGPGWVVTVCGPLGCLERLSTDAGPALYLQRAGRIGDLSSVMFTEVCGPLSAGLCRGSYTIIGRPDQHPEDPPADARDDAMRREDGPVPTLPATDR